MRGPRAAHDVVHPDRLEAALIELGQARLQQPAYRLAALRAQFPVLRRAAAAERWPLASCPFAPGPACG